jgi:hypothetical protein
VAEVTMSIEEYEALREGFERIRKGQRIPLRKNDPLGPKPKRKPSAYSKRYGAAFKRIAPKNKKKGGGWKQGGFMRTQKAAHKAAKK